MENNHLKARMNISAMEFQITKNIQILLKVLPEKSPNRKSILYFLSQVLKKREIIEYYHISKDTYHHNKEKGKYLLDQLYPVGVERERVSEAQKKEIIRILNDILLIQSGKRYRYQKKLMILFTENIWKMSKRLASIKILLYLHNYGWKICSPFKKNLNFALIALNLRKKIDLRR
jgi:hypothetical protein